MRYLGTKNSLKEQPNNSKPPWRAHGGKSALSHLSDIKGVRVPSFLTPLAVTRLVAARPAESFRKLIFQVVYPSMAVFIMVRPEVRIKVCLSVSWVVAAFSLLAFYASDLVFFFTLLAFEVLREVFYVLSLACIVWDRMRVCVCPLPLPGVCYLDTWLRD